MAKIKIEKYEGLDLTDYEILQRSIKDANAKLDRIAKNYGIDSTIYKNNLAKILQTFPQGQFPDRYLTTEKGVTHISQKIKMDIPEKEYLEKAKLLTEKVETISDVKRTVSKAIKEIYNLDVDSVNNIPKHQQNKLVTNIYKLKDGFDKIIKEFYEVSSFYGREESIGLKPDVLIPILQEQGIARQYPELIRTIENNMASFESKDIKGWSIVNTAKKTYNDMNNLIILTEAMVKLLDNLNSDVEIYENFIREKGKIR